MGLLEQARALSRHVISGVGGFSSPIIFNTPGGTVTKTIRGLAIKHSTAINDVGAPVRGETARVTINEVDLFNVGYPVRNEAQKVDLKNHKVTFTDSEGIEETFIINEVLPNRTLGHTVCVLGWFLSGDTPRRVVKWKSAPIYVTLVDTVDPDNEQTLANGDVIPREYVINVDGTITVPYLTSISGIVVNTPFIMDNNNYGEMPYSSGTFNNSANGGFSVGSQIAFNASIPIWLV